MTGAARPVNAAGRMRPRIGGRGPFGKTMRPVGSEYTGKDGVVYVKVAEYPTVAGSKDNWVPKNRAVWERTRGLRLPKGWVVMFCDRDRSNYAPENLKAIPRALVGVLNGGPAWLDRATLEAAVASAMLTRALRDAAARPRKCAVCGEEFVPDARSVQTAARQATCRSCLDKGRRAAKVYPMAECPVCGRSFRTVSAHHIYCSAECRNAHERERRRERRGRKMG